MTAWIRTLFSKLRTSARLSANEQEFDRELTGHLEMATEENVRRGMSREQAAKAARIRLGGTTQLRETNRELRGLPVLETFFYDVRYALRVLRKNPGFTAVAVLTLALGIGANAAIFSVVYSVLLKPLPFPSAGQLYFLFQERESDAKVQTGVSFLNMQDVMAQSTVFTGATVTQAHELTLTGHGDPLIVKTGVVSVEFFDIFQQKPVLGRAFTPEDGKPGAAPVAVLNETLWRNEFRADPNVLGTAINLDKRAFTIVGVMPADFRFPFLSAAGKVWIPLRQDTIFGPWVENRGGHWGRVTVRVKPGVSDAQVRGELDTIGRRLTKQFPDVNTGWKFQLVPFQDSITGDVRSPLLVLLGAVALVLLIVCANLANLLLARATSRTREIAVRTALGAGRGRLVRQFLSESAVLGVLGGTAGVLLAYLGVRGLASMIPSSVPQYNPIRVDNAALLFALVISTLAIFLFGLAPAFFIAKSDPQASLRERSSRSGEGRAGRRARAILAGVEIALAMVLLVAAGLLIRSFARLTGTSPGFETEHIVKANVALPVAQYKTPQQWLAFTNDLLARVQAEPGMHKSAMVVPTPLADGFINLVFDVVGQPPPSAADSRTANYVSVTPNYLEVMGIPLLSGRFFDARDAMSSPRVTVISAAMARVYFPNQNPIGQRLSFAFPPDKASPREIVGVIGDVRDESLGQDPRPMMYVPFAQSPLWGGDLVVNSTLSTSSVVSAIRADILKIDKDLPAGDITTMTEVLSTNVAQPRFRTFLIALFGAMALILAATGIFGVISYSVSRRTQEIGIRIALGASRAAILQMVLRETLILALAGLAVGIPFALASSHLIGHLLFGVSPNDPATLLAVAAILSSVALLSACIPARRAVTVDPLEALRHE
jgi:predicted permease